MSKLKLKVVSMGTDRPAAAAAAENRTHTVQQPLSSMFPLSYTHQQGRFLKE